MNCYETVELIKTQNGFLFVYLLKHSLLLQIVQINQMRLVVHHADQTSSDANLVNASKRALCAMERHR